MVYHILYSRQVQNDACIGARLRYYDGIEALLRGERTLWVFSLNHDVMVEMDAARLQIKVYTGFGPQHIELPARGTDGRMAGMIQGEILDSDTIEQGALYYPNSPAVGIYLRKLHGLLDIFACNDGKDLVKLLPSSASPEWVTRTLRSANEDLWYGDANAPGGRARVTNEIAYADAQGEMQFLRRTLLAGAFKFDQRASQVLPQKIVSTF